MFYYSENTLYRFQSELIICYSFKFYETKVLELSQHFYFSFK